MCFSLNVSTLKHSDDEHVYPYTCLTSVLALVVFWLRSGWSVAAEQPHRATSTTEGAIIKETPVKPGAPNYINNEHQTEKKILHCYLKCVGSQRRNSTAHVQRAAHPRSKFKARNLFGAMHLARNCNFIEEAPFVDCCFIVWGFYKVKNYKLKYCFFQIMRISVAESQSCQGSISFVRVNWGRVPPHPF